MPNILLIGANGQLGQYLVDVLGGDHDLVCLTRDELDLTQPQHIAAAIHQANPDMVINASAYTAVDQAEQEADLAFLINATAPEKMAHSCSERQIPLIHFSTDYVFAGDAGTPYQESDTPHPQGVYGQSKLQGEQAILDSHCEAYIFRTAWVYSQRGKNFYQSMLRLAKDRQSLGIVADQFGSPTYALCIANAVADIVKQIFDQSRSTQAGVYHMTCAGMTNWSGFAKTIFQLENVDIQVDEIASSEYPTPAKRPAYSVLDNRKLLNNFGVQLPSWQDGLTACVAENMIGNE